MALALQACVTTAAGGEASTSTAARAKSREPSTFEQRWQTAGAAGGEVGGRTPSMGNLYVCDDADPNSSALCSGGTDITGTAIRTALADKGPELRACLHEAEPRSWVKVATACSCGGTGSPGLSPHAVSCVTALVRQALSGMDTGSIDEVTVMHTPGAAEPVHPEARGSLEKTHIQSIIHGRIGEVRARYVGALDVWPGLAGRTEICFVIGPDGRVSIASTVASSLHNPALECCINTAVHGWRFAKPEGGGIVVVNYPFVLEQTNSRARG